MLLWILFLIQWVACAPTERELQLTELSLQSPDRILHISNSDVSLLFDKNQDSRDYWTMVTITSTKEEHKCIQCPDIGKIFSIVAKSWFEDHAQSNLVYFASIDLVDPSNMDIFRKLGLQSVPNIWLFPPAKNSQDVKRYGIEYLPHLKYKTPEDTPSGQALQLAQFLSENVQKPIFIREANQMATFIKMFTITLTIIVLIKKRGPKVFKKIQKKNGYQMIAVLLILLFTCGYSFATINGVAFIATNDKNQPIYVSGGLHYQFGVEIVLVGLNYFLLGASLISLIAFGNYKVTETLKINTEERKFIVVLFNCFVVYLLYSCLTSIFLRKVDYYPYPLMKMF